MKWNRFPPKAILLLVAVAWAGLALAAPRYTDKSNALELAEALDKGIYQGRLVTSTFIQSVGKGRYLVKVVLDNGAEHDWDIARIRTLSKREQIVLRENGALLFPSEEDNDFVVLDKKRFARTALRGKVFVKHYGPSDPLAGQKLNFGIHRFNLVELLQVKPGKDEHGYRHHYIFDLENGQRERLSYLDAYHALARKALMEDPSTVSPLVRAPYRIQGIEAVSLQEEGDTGTGKFGFEIIFDRPLALEPGHFPFRFFENGNGRRARRGAAPDFLIEFVAPNTVMGDAITPIETVEFLRNVHALPDPRHEVRLLVRAGISPEVMTFPPEVEVQGSRVLVSFTKVVDQTVFDRQARAAEELRLKQDRLLHRTLTPEEVEQRKTYRALMSEGDQQRNRARRAKPFPTQFDLLTAAMNAFQEAAVNASTDAELKEALRERNTILAKLPILVVRHVRGSIKKEGGARRAELRELLDRAALMTRDREVLRAIHRLIEDPALR
jgi:hypothetical protein